MRFINNSKGNVLVTLLVFVVIAVVIISAFTTITIINTQTTSVFSKGNYTYEIAELGIEESIIRLLRDPDNYTGGTLSINGNTVNINVSGTTTKTIVSEAVSGTYRRKIQVTATVENNKVTILTWREIT